MASSPFCGGNYLHSHFNHSLRCWHAKLFDFFHPIEDKCEVGKGGAEREWWNETYPSVKLLLLYRMITEASSALLIISNYFNTRLIGLIFLKKWKKHKAYTTRSVTIAIISPGLILSEMSSKKKKTQNNFSCYYSHFFVQRLYNSNSCDKY